MRFRSTLSSTALVSLALLACTPSGDTSPATTPSSAAVPSVTGLTAVTPTTPATPTTPTTSVTPTTAGSEGATKNKSCANDTDCEISVFPGCCACPQTGNGAPHALNKSGTVAEKELCTRVRCDNSQCAKLPPMQPNEPATNFIPKCVASTCTALHK